ncbi:hypothetical protein FPQ18DRAFT_308920 [Pyronema domesticum]|uniref:Uncharacterized protein n=1 Tax=Pyronema omphalodes (strain CBS 100304) TaxID=1076935 RepID=U4LR80_PYROM|nr:hypothetical protein FPQ18DRAFT_308920 [Pyronema domesticum]CCX34696.1 Protein of unknown function [Pyronema omphalodes CBS 100304]
MKLVATTIISLMAILAVAAPSADPAGPKTPPAPGSKDNKDLSPHSKSTSAGAPAGSDCYWIDGKTQKAIYGKWVCCKKEIESGAIKSITCVKHDLWVKLSKPTCPKAHPTATCCPVGKDFTNGQGCNDNPNAGVAGKQ